MDPKLAYTWAYRSDKSLNANSPDIGGRLCRSSPDCPDENPNRDGGLILQVAHEVREILDCDLVLLEGVRVGFEAEVGEAGADVESLTFLVGGFGFGSNDEQTRRSNGRPAVA
jgi:hypothetical protein